MTDLQSLRTLGARYIAATCVLSTLMVAVAGSYTGQYMFALAGVGAAILPLVFGITGRADQTARIVLGATLPVYAAFFVALAAGTGWIIDMHMVFFAFLAMTAIMADWRAVLIATAVIAVHHLALNFIAPFYVFPDGADLTRVLFHAGVVIVEAVTLALLCQRLESLCIETADARRLQAEETAKSKKVQDKAQREQKIVLDGLQGQLQALSQGNLLARIKDEFPGGNDGARQSFNETCEGLRQVVSTVAENSDCVDHSAGQIREASQTLAEHSEKQASAVEKVSLNANAMFGDFEKNAAQWREARESAREARGKADEGGAVIERAASAIDRIKVSSGEIGEMVALIDSIAFQTNLLALNAGVEAARAGESGKGFAVVANEVRELAQRSGDSASNIKQLIDRSNAEVNEGVEQVGQMVGLLEEVVERITHITDKIDSLAGKSESSLDSVKEIRQAIGSIEGTMQHIAAMSEETNASSVELTSQAAALRRSIAHFTYKDDDGASFAGSSGGFDETLAA